MSIQIVEAVKLQQLLDKRTSFDDTIEVVTRLDSIKDIKKVLFNREPYLLIDRAVVFHQDVDGQTKNRIIGQLTITDQHCAGHYPGYPMLPFAIMGEIIGQVGAILLTTSYWTEIGDAVPLVVEVTNLRSGNSGPIFPGDVLTVVAEVILMRGGFSILTATMIVRDETVITLDKVSFLAVRLPLKRLENGDVEHEQQPQPVPAEV
ncbi:MAG: hypothetical protein JW816_01345 [Candidatus Buchananbacteria bacterium]|nr:hypothetical protein [Candidatus Buchananbacteria bacterium]